MITWSQLGIHRKPCGLLNVAGYFDHLIGMFDYAVAHKFISAANREIVLEARAPAELVDRMVTLTEVGLR